MAHTRLFAEGARTAVARAVEAVEAETAAEVVVTVRKASAVHLWLDLLAGFAAALAALLALLFLEQPFALWHFPVDTTLAFALGAWLFHRLPWLRRPLLQQRATTKQVRLAARAAFWELGVSRTRGRTGLLVYASVLEGRVELVPDLEVDLGAMAAELEPVRAALATAVRADDAEAFARALEGLATPLGALLPRTEDDVNELPDALEVTR